MTKKNGCPESRQPFFISNGFLYLITETHLVTTPLAVETRTM